MNRSRYAPDALAPAVPWTRYAACAGEQGDVFFDDQLTSVAMGICQACPVRPACLADAIATEGGTAPTSRFGVFGGLGPAERYRIATGRKAKTGRSPAPCGTDAGYRRHIRNGEPADEPCLAAHRQFARDHYHQAKARSNA